MIFAATLDLETEKANPTSDMIYSVAFSPDGTKIVSGSDDQTIKVWGEPPIPTATSPLPANQPCIEHLRC